MSLTRQSKKHLYNVYDTMLDLDANEKGILSHAFLCTNKQDARQCRNNVQNVIAKGVLKTKYTTHIINAVNDEDQIYWFCIVTKL